MTDTPRTYTLDMPAGIQGTVMTAPRPLPGRLIGHRGTTAFAVYDVLPAYEAEARRLDGQIIEAITPEAIAAAVEGYAKANGYPMSEVLDAYDDDLVLAFTDMGLGRITTITPSFPEALLDAIHTAAAEIPDAHPDDLIDCVYGQVGHDVFSSVPYEDILTRLLELTR